jgi:hypothetical protein
MCIYIYIYIYIHTTNISTHIPYACIRTYKATAQSRHIRTYMHRQAGRDRTITNNHKLTNPQLCSSSIDIRHILRFF